MLTSTAALAAALLVAAVSGGDAPGAGAGEAPPAGTASGSDGQAPATESSPGDARPKDAPKDAATRDKPGGRDREDSWIDVGHAFIEHRVFAPVLRLDRFFSDERAFDAERSRSFIRWRNQVYFTEDRKRPLFTTGLHANLRLPGLNQELRRFRIVLAGETRDALQSLFPHTTGAAGDEDTLGTPNAGLRLYFLDTLIAHADLGAGVLTRLPPGVYSQVRLRAAVPAGKLFLTRSVWSGFWRTDTHLGTSVGLELERLLPRALVARVDGTATLTQLSHGVEWIGEASVFATIDEHSAAQLAVAVNGASRPALASDGVTRPPDLDRVRLYTRLRRDVFRRWIFLELEPEYAFPWTLERRRHTAWGVTFRVELQFQGEEAPPPPPPDEPPEPKDPTSSGASPERPPAG